MSEPPEIVYLNVGGTKFCTSRHTLCWVGDTFFTALLSGRTPSLRDAGGAIFIDRDPRLFSVVLNYLRSKSVELNGLGVEAVRHEAEFYGVLPLVRRLTLCAELDTDSCGGLLFHTLLPPAVCPSATAAAGAQRVDACVSTSRRDCVSCDVDDVAATAGRRHLHSCRDLRACDGGVAGGRCERDDSAAVRHIRGHHNWVVVAYSRFVTCYRLSDATGWALVYTSPRLVYSIDMVAVNAKVLPSVDSSGKMVAVACASIVHLWSIGEDGSRSDIGRFDLSVPVEHLFFIGPQLVALSSRARIGVWHASSQHWRAQATVSVACHDCAGSFLLLGATSGSIYYIDMQKFPLRMKDNDLLLTELYHDVSNEPITAISVYVTPKTSISGHWIEIAYGTSAGVVRVIVQHPETVGNGPQLFQTFSVHRSPITRVSLSERYLISVCSEYQHVRSWSVTRFRGMISTQPDSQPLASFKVIDLEEGGGVGGDGRSVSRPHSHSPGPFGEQDGVQVFVQRVVPSADTLFVRRACDGRRVCQIRAIDNTSVTAYCVHECEASCRVASRPRRYLITGHSNGSLQMWDLSTALAQLAVAPPPSVAASATVPAVTTAAAADAVPAGGPTAGELLRLLEPHCLSETTPHHSPAAGMSTLSLCDSPPTQHGRGSVNTDV